MGNQSADRIGGLLDVQAPHGKGLPTEPVIDLQRLGAEGALAKSPGALDDVSMQPLSKVAAQRMHLLAPADKAGLEHARAAIWIRPLGAPFGCLDRDIVGAFEPRPE